MELFYSEDLSSERERVEVEIPKPANDHCHFRWDERMDLALPAEMKVFQSSLPMPNDGPLDRPAALSQFQSSVCEFTNGASFRCLWTFFLSRSTTVQMINEFKSLSSVATKIYMKGATTNSEDGIVDLLAPDLDLIFQELEQQSLVTCIHPESCGFSILRREIEFITVIDELVRRYPGLKISVEHITTKQMVEAVLRWPTNVTATITAHHLFLTLDDVIGERRGATKIRPHNYCLPVAKEPEHIVALRRAAFSGHEKFRLGTDSAPHKIHTKESAEGCAGLYTTPVVMPLLIELFGRYSNLENLVRFTSLNSQLFWGYEPTTESVVYVPEPWQVPAQYKQVVPFLAGEILPYQLK